MKWNSCPHSSALHAGGLHRVLVGRLSSVLIGVEARLDRALRLQPPGHLSEVAGSWLHRGAAGADRLSGVHIVLLVNLLLVLAQLDLRLALEVGVFIAEEFQVMLFGSSVHRRPTACYQRQMLLSDLKLAEIMSTHPATGRRLHIERWRFLLPCLPRAFALLVSFILSRFIGASSGQLVSLVTRVLTISSCLISELCFRFWR